MRNDQDNETSHKPNQCVTRTQNDSIKVEHEQGTRITYNHTIQLLLEKEAKNERKTPCLLE